MAVRISFPAEKAIEARLRLPASKSISNRALLICALGGLDSRIDNLSTSDDTVRLSKILAGALSWNDCGDGGTTSRFLLAYCCVKGLDVEIKGSDQLNARPVAELVDALNALGAKIIYGDREGYLPVRTGKGKLIGGDLKVRGDVSSQFVSSLMMIGPLLERGLKLSIEGEVLSRSYIEMTASVMRHYGVDVTLHENEIIINEASYMGNHLHVEPDWSAASYWFEACALRNGSRIELSGLAADSLQGDSVVVSMMKNLGVKTDFIGDNPIKSVLTPRF